MLPKILSADPAVAAAAFERSLIRQEAKLGGQLFGPVPVGHRREFFCLDRHTWIWHEEWPDTNGKNHSVTTRYAVRANSILKSQNNQPFQPISEHEARNLYQTAELYRARVGAEYQRAVQAA